MNTKKYFQLCSLLFQKTEGERRTCIISRSPTTYETPLHLFNSSININISETEKVKSIMWMMLCTYYIHIGYKLKIIIRKTRTKRKEIHLHKRRIVYIYMHIYMLCTIISNKISQSIAAETEQHLMLMYIQHQQHQQSFLFSCWIGGNYIHTYYFNEIYLYRRQ